MLCGASKVRAPFLGILTGTDVYIYPDFRLMQQTAFTSIEAWSRIRHPNIISVREAFTTRAFADNCMYKQYSTLTPVLIRMYVALVVVYDYHPNARTLYEAHIKPKAPQYQNGRLMTQSPRLPERTIWSYVIQIARAIKAVHDAGMAVRIIDATKVLVTGQNRYGSQHSDPAVLHVDLAVEFASALAVSWTYSRMTPARKSRSCNRRTS